MLEPFLTPWWRANGFSAVEIGALTAIGPGVAAIAPFLWTAYADATRQGDRIFLRNTWLTALAALFLPLVTWLPAVAFAMLLFAAVRAPLIPLANAMTLQALGGRRQGYAAVRLWGTLGYILSAVLAGRLVDWFGLRPTLCGAAAATAACGTIAWIWRRRERVQLPVARLRDILETLRDRRLILLVVSAALAWASYGPYAAFFTIHLDRLGFSRSFAGTAWAVAAASELLVMLLWSRLAPRCDSRTWFLVGLGAGPLRWVLLAVATGTPLLLLAQCLHAGSFGIFYVAAVERVDALARPGLSATAQGVFAAATFGVGGLLGSLAGGLLYEPLGMRRLFLLAAGVSAGAVLLYWAGTRRDIPPARAASPEGGLR